MHKPSGISPCHWLSLARERVNYTTVGVHDRIVEEPAKHITILAGDIGSSATSCMVDNIGRVEMGHSAMPLQNTYLYTYTYRQ